jgi:hypothetical protein
MRNDRDACAPLARTLPIGHSVSVPSRSEEEVDAAERVCAFCGELAPGRLFAKGPPPVAICPACRVWSRTALQRQLLGIVRCGFCARLHPAGGDDRGRAVLTRTRRRDLQ